MSQAASQAYKFYEQVAEEGRLWAAKESGEFVKFKIGDDKVSMPLWSSRSRIDRIKKADPEANGKFLAFEISWNDFIADYAPDMIDSNTLIGVNLSGKNLVGYDRDTQGVISSVQSCLEAGS